MTWSRFDDGYDEHEKIENAWFDDDATIGLHAMATTACNRWLSDGVIRPRWLQHKLPAARKRAAVLAAMVRHGLFDVLETGRERTLVDDAGNEIPVGPFDEDRYIVHDFLDRHESSVQVKDRRRKDSERKKPKMPAESAASPDGLRKDSERNPRGRRTDSNASRTRPREGAPAHPDPTRPDQQPPLPPDGGRKRDRDLYEKEVTAYATVLFPDADPVEAAGHVRNAIGRLGAGCTTEQVREAAARWLEPATIPKLGARLVAFNADADGAAA
jgi:hypothetical protein